jgi:NTP pyrophosphatase (non-canonical NTP hydrolase)
MSMITDGFGLYQARAVGFAVYPDRGSNVSYPALGLCGEAGEVAEKVKKVIRDSGGIVSDEAREALKLELGDVLWYVSQLAEELRLDLGDIAEANIAKLTSRRERNALQGSGDNR